MNRLVIFMMLLACVWSGCEFKGGKAAAPNGPDTAGWFRVEPATMRVLPSSRLGHGAVAGPVLDAHVELTDAMGDAVKAAGDVRFELYDARNAGGGPRLYAWDVSLRTPEEQKRFYDPITRGYHFRLKLDAGVPLPERARIVATYMPPAGQRIEAALEVETAGR